MGTEIVKANGGGEIARPDESAIIKLVTTGDLSKLSELQVKEYYNYRCHAIGIDPADTPFELIKLNGKLVMYAKKACSDQLTATRKLSVEITATQKDGDLLIMKARAQYPDGRAGEDIGAVSIKGLAGDNLANAYMKCATKAKRRTVLSLCGLGMLDETELETIPGLNSGKRAVEATQAKAETLAQRIVQNLNPPSEAATVIDAAPDEGRGEPEPENTQPENPEAEPPPGPALKAGCITEKQAKRLWAIARSVGWKDAAVRDLLVKQGFPGGTMEVTKAKYEGIIGMIENGTGGGQ